MIVRSNKKIKVNKNRKKSWRKHTDISEYEEFLNEKRFEERIGYSIGQAQNDELFVIEKTGNDDVYQKKFDQSQCNKKQRFKRESLSESKLRKISLSHRLYQKLESTSQVPPLMIGKKNSDKRRTIYNDDDKLKRYWNNKKELIQQAKQQKEIKQKAKDDSKSRFDNQYDLWDDNQNEKNVKTVKVPEHLRQKPSLLPAVEIPLPGQSYNPSEEDYKSLILSETEKELAKINGEKILANKVDKYFLTKDEAQTNEKQWLDEMSQGLFEKDNDKEIDEDKDEELDEEEIKFSIVKRSNKKTKSQKRREIREKLARKQKEQEKAIRIKENDVFRIKTIEREIKDQEQKIKERAIRRQTKHIESFYKPKRLSRYRFEETEMELNLPSEISRSLLSIKTEGNVLHDRFKSFQKRNLIETRVLHLPKHKYKLRKETKRRYRELLS